MQVNQNQSAAAMMGPDAAKANKNIFYNKDGSEKSLKEVYELMGQKMAKAEGTVSNGKTSVAAATPVQNKPAATSEQKSAATPTTPTTGATPPASTTQTALTKPAATPTNANMPTNPLDALKQGLDKSNQASLGGPTPAGPASQENPTTLLSSLNMKMDQLIRIQSGAKETGEKQLKKTASGGANMDMFTNVSIV
jgi:hypothetical protein